MSSEIYTISTAEAILRIKKLMENKQGDQGRLEFISEALQKGKNLFNSDQIYLKKKILADVTPDLIKKPSERDRKIKKVERLISLNLGEPGRLRHILHSLQNNRKIYNSDENYIRLKIEQFLEFREGRKLRQGKRIRVPFTPKPEKREEVFYDQTSEIVIEEPIIPPQDMPERLQKIEDAVLSSKPKEALDLVDLLEDSSQVNLGIEKERQKISRLKHDYEQLKIQRDELSQLIAYRQEYEIKINREKERLEKEIKIEQKKITEKDKLVEELIKNQSRIIQTKTEKEVLLEQVKIEKARSDLDLKREQDELEKVKKEYEDLQNQIRKRKQSFDEQVEKNQRSGEEKVRIDAKSDGLKNKSEELKKVEKEEEKSETVVKKSKGQIKDQKDIVEANEKLDKLKTDFDDD